MNSKTVAVLFLCFSAIVAFFNILIEKYFLIAFIVPFALSVALRGLPSRLFEIAGLYFISMYFIVFESVQFGSMGLIIMSCFVYALNYRLIVSRVTIYINSIVIFAISYSRAVDSADRIVHAGLDAAFYIIGAFSLYCVFIRAIEENKSKDKPLDQKCLETLDEAVSLARDSINTPKK